MFRTHLWKLEIQKLVDETGLAITVCHLPPGISMWNKIDYQVCAYVIQNWRDQPLISYAVVNKLVAPTMAPTGFKAQRHIDANIYPSGYNGSEAKMASMILTGMQPTVSGTISFFRIAFPSETLILWHFS